MVLDTDKSHRSGIWKQNNKAHKTGRHRSKGCIDSENKGRVSVKVASRKLKKDFGKANRRHHALQMRAKKKEEVLRRKRGIGGRDAPPHLVAVIPLHHDTDVNRLLEKICVIEDSTVYKSATSPHGNAISVSIPRLKHRFTFITPQTPTLPDVLDCGLVADSVLFLLALDPENPVDVRGQTFLSALLAQGLSASVLVTCGLDNVATKKRAEVKKSIQKAVSRSFPDVKLHSVGTDQDALLMLRTVAEQKRKTVNLRLKRPYMLADEIRFECEGDNSDKGTLAVTGFVRGECLDVNRLVHVVGWGDFQLSRIESASNPFASVKSRKRRKNADLSADAMELDDLPGGSTTALENVDMSSQEVLAKSEPDARQDLVREAAVDPLDAEQTWPTRDEIKEAEEAMDVKQKKRQVKKVPEGTSEYQAAWILDSDHEWEDEEEEDDDVSMENDDELLPVADEDSQIDAEEFERARVSESTQNDGADVPFETASQYDEGMDFEEECRALERYKEERSHAMFPDEVDTPHDVPARMRFQKYRGLESFRTSPWDAKENLPLNYARIFQFQNFDRTRRRIRTLDVDETVKPGMYVTLYLENVPKLFVDSHSSHTILYGMFPHEQKMSVTHLALKRTVGPYGDVTVKNKDEMLFYVGFRRFRARPLFSQHTNGDKHKMERYLAKDGVSIASIYAQVTFPPANVLMFKESPSGLLPVASGGILKIDPDRVITKKIVLSGHPLRIHKRLVTVRYMFFNAEDILWFKPVKLRTKWGRKGHIKEPLGTHGHMKCTFDSQLMSQDTVLLSLYKRVFPKWSYELVTPANKGKVFDAGSECGVASNRPREVTFDENFFE